MSEEDALLTAVAVDPDDDTPRLVYADWCDENGLPERAEFIRVQCERARLSKNHPRAAVLREREQVLLNVHHDEWAGPFRRLKAGPLAFSRGFWDPAELHTASAGDEKTLLEVASSPFALWLTKLRCTFRLSDAGATAFAASPQLTRLRELSLRPATPAALAAVVSSPNLIALNDLALSGRLSDDGARTLAAHTALPALTLLNLSDNEIGDDGVKALAASDRLSGLILLNLSWNPVGPTGLAALAASPWARKLTSLGLRGTPCEPEHITAYDQGVAVDTYPDEEAVTRIEAMFGGRVRIF